MTLSIDRPGKGIERGLRTRSWRGLTWIDTVLHWLANERQGRLWLQCRASFLTFTLISNSKLSFFSKSQNLALKRNVKRPLWLQTYIFPMNNQSFWWKFNTFSMGGLVLVFGWSWGGLGVVLGWWRVDEGSMKGSMKGRWRIDEGINGVSRLVCQRQFEVEENSFCLATWLRLSESGWLNSSLDWPLQVWLQCSSPPSCSQHVLK